MSGRRNLRCANDFIALREHETFCGAIGLGHEDKRGQGDRYGYEAIVEPTTELLDPIGQISPSWAHGRVSLLDPARIAAYLTAKPFGAEGRVSLAVTLERSTTAPVANKARHIMRLRLSAGHVAAGASQTTRPMHAPRRPMPTGRPSRVGALAPDANTARRWPEGTTTTVAVALPNTVCIGILVTVMTMFIDAGTGLTTAAVRSTKSLRLGVDLRSYRPLTPTSALAPRRSATRPAPHPRRAASPAGSSRCGSPPDRGATSVRRQGVQRRNQAIASAVKKMKMGLSATAAFTTNRDWVASAGKLCIALFPCAPGDRIFRCGQGAVLDADLPLGRIGRASGSAWVVRRPLSRRECRIARRRETPPAVPRSSGVS